MKKSFIFLLVIIAAVVGFVLWSKGAPEPLPPLTTTDTTSDIEKDLNNLTITEEDEGYTEIQSDLNSL